MVLGRRVVIRSEEQHLDHSDDEPDGQGGNEERHERGARQPRGRRLSVQRWCSGGASSSDRKSNTSTTRMTNQMARAATKSATNVAPDNREADGSVFSDGAREARRHPRPAPPPPLPCPAAWTPRRTPLGGAPSCA